MESEHKLYTWIVGLITGGVVALFAIGCHYYVANTALFANNGYVDTTLPGSSVSHWTKR